MSSTLPDTFLRLRRQLIVSCQASEGDVFRSPERFAQAAVAGGAGGIRADGPEDVRAIRRVVQVPVIGILKAVQSDGRILITPSFDAAVQLADSGADLIALDCTRRGQEYGALQRIQQIKSGLGIPVLADIATVEEALQAVAAGADGVLSTMRGYTLETEHIQVFQPSFIARLVRAVDVPVIAEGRIHTPAQLREAMIAGAFAVVVGSAITRPREIARRFVAALLPHTRSDAGQYFVGIDLGGTNTKAGLVCRIGEISCTRVLATPAGGGRDTLLDHLKRVANEIIVGARDAGVSPAAIGVATAGWVNPETGCVVHATGNLPGWTGTQIAEELKSHTRLPVTVENDANALAVAEKCFGAAADAETFVCITLGTGIGGGCYVGGQLMRGAHFFANALGHLNLEPQGPACTCGQRGCLETFANAAALVRYARTDRFATAEEVIAAANAGDAAARAAIRTYAGYLARGCASVVYLLDPEMLILSGGLAQNNPHLISDLTEELAKLVSPWSPRNLRILPSSLGYYSGALGAAAVAMHRWNATCEAELYGSTSA